MKEIERKYRVKSEAWKASGAELSSSLIQQGYLNADPNRVVRVRIRDNRAFITVKNKPVGITRSEFEYSIPVEDAQELLKMCLGKILVKRRYETKFQSNIWEVDEFFGHLEGLVLAEIELESEEQKFEIPEWVGEDVSDNSQYSNMSLALS